MILVFIFEHIPILKQLPDFSSCRVFGTYPGFETITRIYINVNFQFSCIYKIKILLLFCPYKIDLTRNSGNGLFRMREIKSTLFS